LNQSEEPYQREPLHRAGTLKVQRERAERQKKQQLILSQTNMDERLKFRMLKLLEDGTQEYYN